MLEYTATWCGPCGSYGAPQMHDIYNLGNVVGITAHADGDPMHNATLYSSFASARPTGGGIPSFWVGDVSDGDVNDMQTLLQRVPEAGVACTHSIVGNKMEVKALVEFFKNLSGDFYLSVYLLESGIDGSAGAGDHAQSGTNDPEYKHDFVLRTAATPSNAYGEQVASGSVTEGTQIRKDYTIDINPLWNTEKVYAAVVLWKKDSGSGMYEFINAFELGSHISH
ncbi:MAG: Omp28-related outer membrane protein [Bacteroidales bacterium]